MYYHGSDKLFPKIEMRQPNDPNGPDLKKRYGVYMTPDFGTALAFACRTEGSNEFDHGGKTMKLEHPEMFDPDKEVYVYCADLAKIPAEKILHLSEFQVVVLQNVVPDEVKTFKAAEALKYYTLV